MWTTLKVLTVTFDNVLPNRKLFRMHFSMTRKDELNPDTDATYPTVNLFRSGKSFIHFNSDFPHLMKTARNCLYNSGKGRYTWSMQKNGAFILWNHISDIFHEDTEYGLQLLPKLSNKHIKLTPYSKRNISCIINCTIFCTLHQIFSVQM